MRNKAYRICSWKAIMIHPSSRLNRMNGFVIIELSIKSLQAFMFEFDKMLLLFKKNVLNLKDFVFLA